jgi:2-isopropylmalate synthase
VLLRERATGAGQAVTTDIIEAAGMAYTRALTNAVRRMQAQADAQDEAEPAAELAAP